MVTFSIELSSKPNKDQKEYLLMLRSGTLTIKFVKK